MVFPIPGGLLQTAEFTDDLLSGEVVVADGRDEFVDTISEFDLAHADTRLLDVLACQGCYAGAGMTSDSTMLQRRTAHQQLRPEPPRRLHRRGTAPTIEAAKEKYADIDLSREHELDEQTLGDSSPPRRSWKRSSTAWASSSPRTSSTAAPADTTAAWSTPEPSTPGWPDSEMCLPHTIEQLRGAYQRPGGLAPLPRRGQGGPGALAASSPAWANSPPASPTRSTTPWARCCCTPTCSSRSAKTTPATGGPRDHRRPGQPLQAHHLGPAQLRPPEPGAPPAHQRGRAGREDHPHRARRRQRAGAAW